MRIIKKQTEAVELLLREEPVVIFQGSSEFGPRALGNRSMLFDPRNKKAKEIINKIKGRQWWRPTAATILHEHKDDWFDFGSLDESPFMSFAVHAKDKAKQETPAVVHVNNTCRIQTLKRDQNPHYYDLINAFYKKSKVPMLLNTSFNLAGWPLVETFNDATYTVLNSKLNYMYCP
jgi:carbamoyltransferase